MPKVTVPFLTVNNAKQNRAYRQLLASFRSAQSRVEVEHAISSYSQLETPPREAAPQRSPWAIAGEQIVARRV